MDKLLKFFGLVRISYINCTINLVDRNVTKCKLRNLDGNISDFEMNNEIALLERVGFQLINNRLNQ